MFHYFGSLIQDKANLW